MQRATIALTCALCTLPVWAAEPVAGVQRWHQYTPELAIAGQPRRADFPAIAAAGYKVVIHVASADSNPDQLRDEKQLVESAGMRYHLVPLTWSKPDPALLLEAVKLLRDHQGQGTPVLVHCYVGSRASLVAYLARVSAGADEAAEKATLVSLWAKNRGYELANAPEWQFALEDALGRLR